MHWFNVRRIGSLLFIVAIAFIFTISFGPGSQGCQGPVVPEEGAAAAAVVNGKEIPLIEFRRNYRNALNMMRNQGVTEGLARQLGYHKQVLEQMVNTELLAQAAERRGIAPSDEELARVIHQNPAFQKDGQFDLQAYRDMLRNYYRQTEVEWEKDLRRQLAAQKMMETVEAAAAVSDDEVKARFLKEANRAQLTWVRFASNMFSDKVPRPTPQDAASYRAAHPKEIEAYYETNKFAYSQPEQVRARHILIKVDPSAAPEKKAEVRQKIESLRKEIVEGGKDFAAMAKEFSEDEGSKVNGGDLGFNPADAWVKPFSDAAFALKTGEVSQPVESQFGVHLIKVEERKPPMNRALPEVQDEIAGILWKQEKAKELAQKAAAEALAQVKAGKDLKALFPEDKEPKGQFAPPTKPSAVETPEFDASAEAVPRLGPAPALLTDVFERKEPGVLDEVYPVADSFVVANVTARSLPQDSEFDAKKDELRAEARRAKQFELRDAFLKALRKQGDVKTNDEAIEEALGPATTG